MEPISAFFGFIANIANLANLATVGAFILQVLKIKKKDNPENTQDVSNKSKEKENNIIETSVVNQEVAFVYPGNPLNINSALYIQRSYNESICYEIISQNSALIRIKAPEKFGKTSLMDRILSHATTQKKFKAVRLNLARVDKTFLTNLDQFLKWICNNIAAQLELKSQVDNSWDEKNMGSMVSCTNYFQLHILSVETPLILVFDGVDKLFQYKEIAQEFFPLLRTWHEEYNNTEIWGQLRLVLAHSTEAYIPLSINASPFNVGFPIELPELTREQVWELVQKYQIPKWSLNHVERLMTMVGGHPFLIQLALYHIQRRDFTLNELLETAVTEAGIYMNHLKEYAHYLNTEATLSELLKKIVFAKEKIRVNTNELIPAYKLHSKGLAKMSGSEIEISCDLYRQYFQKTLNRIE